MANYPSFPQLVGSSFVSDDGVQVKRATSGKPRIKTNYSQSWGEGSIIHELNQTDLNTLNTFYTTNKGISFTFFYAADNSNYSCQFASKPKAIPIAGGYYDVEVLILEI